MPPASTPGAWLAPTALVVPILAACVLQLLERRVPPRVLDVLALATTLGVTGLDAGLLVRTSSARMVTWLAQWRPQHGYSVGVNFTVDEVGAGIALLAAVLVAVATLYAGRYFDQVGAHFHQLMLLFLAGMQGFSMSGDLFDLFVFFELMGASAYALTALKIEDPTSLHGAINFGIINSLGAYVSLFGVAMLYATTGNLGLPQLGAQLAGHRPDLLLVVALVLVICGFLVKSAVVPFHFWLADAHAVAPVPVCVLFSGVMVPLGLYGVLRVYWTAFSRALPPLDVHVAFCVLGALTAILGAVMAVTQRHFKRTLAYSTIAHVGLFLVAAGLLTVDGTAGALLYVLGHAGVKSALFLLAGVTLNRYGSVDERDLHGRGRRHRGTGVLLIVGGLGLAGLPPFATGLGKALGEDAAVHAGDAWLLALFVVVSAMSGGAVLRFAARVYFGWGERAAARPGKTSAGDMEVPEGRFDRLPPGVLASILVLLAGGLALGVLPGAHAAATRAAAAFVDARGYAGAALSVRSAAVPAGGQSGDWSLLGLGLGFASSALAVGVAAAGLHGRALLARAPELRRAGVRVMGVLHAAHSGHVGDYAAWLVAGVAAITALVGATVA